MISYEHISDTFDKMNGISLINNNHNYYKREGADSQLNAPKYNLNSSYSHICDEELHNKIENDNCLQENVWFCETNLNKEILNHQLQYPISDFEHTDIISNAIDATSYNRCEMKPLTQICNILETKEAKSRIQRQYEGPKYCSKSLSTSQTKTEIKKHRGHISLVRTTEGSYKAIIKRKRKRTAFTTEQINALEEYFCQKQYVTRQERQNIVTKLALNDKAVKIWFQNRRLKDKRVQESPNEIDSFPAKRETLLHPCLDFVQSQIDRRTNEFGYVTLDEALQQNLFSIVNMVLENKEDLDLMTDTFTRQENNYPIYESISSAESVSEEEELFSN